MFCKHCGKEISDDSMFCNYCGQRQERCLSILGKHKKELSVWIGWTLLHLSLLFSSYGPFEESGHVYFYPFSCSISELITGDYLGDLRIGFFNRDILDGYDFSEFFFYVVIFPLVLYYIWKLLNKIIQSLRVIKIPQSFKKVVYILSCGMVYVGTIITIMIILMALYLSEARYSFNVEEMGNPSSGWYLSHPGSKLYAYHLMQFLPIYITLFAIIVVSFLAFYISRIWKSNINLSKIDTVTIWCAKIGISLLVGNMIALIIAIPTSQSISAIYTAIIFFIITLIGLSTYKVDKILKL